MHDFGEMARRRPHLFFNGHCPPCRWMSRLAVRLSLGSIRRVPLESADAQTLYEAYPQARGQIVLLYRQYMSFGRPVFAALPLVVLAHWFNVLRDLLPSVAGDQRNRP